MSVPIYVDEGSPAYYIRRGGKLEHGTALSSLQYNVALDMLHYCIGWLIGPRFAAAAAAAAAHKSEPL